jgi:hypothetical protein
MLADPQSVAFPTLGTKSLPAISRGENASAYQSADGLQVLQISHQYGKRTRRAFKISVSKIAADPLISAQNIKYSASVTLVIDQPITGYTPAELLDVVQGLVANLSASTYANTTKVLGGES